MKKFIVEVEKDTEDLISLEAHLFDTEDKANAFYALSKGNDNEYQYTFPVTREI